MLESRAAEPVCGRLQSRAWRESSSQGSREPPCFTLFPPTEILHASPHCLLQAAQALVLLKKCLAAALSKPECASSEPYWGHSRATAMP